MTQRGDGAGPSCIDLGLEARETPCEVWIGGDLLGLGHGPLRADLGGWLAGRTLFVVTSEPLAELLGPHLEPLRGLAARVEQLCVPDGEAAKSLAVAGGLWDRMLGLGGKRDSRLVTFGGGSVGDLGGFVAACFLRGIEYAQVPTTLLAQVDAALGGKTGIDVAGHGKNLVGAFHQPRFVLSDTRLLATLPPAERRSGLVEAVKKAAVLDARVLAELEARLDALLAGDVPALDRAVVAATRMKLGVVAADAREAGARKSLNFGHTLGHAIEAELDFAGLRHGEAVAYGMLFACRLARAEGVLGDDLDQRLEAVLSRFELPPLPVDALSIEGLWSAMAKDKKATEAGLTWVLPTAAGHYTLRAVSGETVRRELAAFLAEPGPRAGRSRPRS
ncbi:MAG: 3-dehydroquinate synthase [Holophagales bacterium]|nr:3-dehydroquinate synthase [Holophagales bacterium]